MSQASALFADAENRHLRIILVHDYPPGVHAYELEQAFKQLGHEVYTAAMGGNTPGLDAPLRSLHPGYGYDLLTDRDTHVNQILEAAGGGDLLLYLEPGRAYLPRDIEDCEIPTLGLLSEEAIHADWEMPLYPAFDIALTAWHAVQRRYQAWGMEQVWQWYYGAAPGFMHNDHIERTEDFVFVGNLHPVIQRDRNLILQRIGELAREDYEIALLSGLFFDRYNHALNRGKATYAGSVTGQINMRVFEAMAAGCLVIVPTPTDAQDPLSQAFEPGREIVYADTVEAVLEAVRHYARDEDARREIADAAERKVRERFQYRQVAERFIREILPRIPSDYRERRDERLRRAGDSAHQRRFNRARFSLGLGSPQASLDILQRGAAPEADAAWSNAKGVTLGIGGRLAQATALVGEAVAQDPTNPVYATNLACLQAHRMLLDEEPLDADLPETVLQLLEETDPVQADLGADAFWYPFGYDRPRIEIARAFALLPPGPERTTRLLDVMRFRLHSLAGAIHARLGDAERSKTHLEAAAVILPDDGYTLAALGDVFAALGRETEATAMYLRAAALEPFHADPQIKRAHQLSNGGLYTEAMEALEQLLAYTPTMSPLQRAEALALLGIAATQTNDLERARASLQASLDIIPEQPVVRRFLDRLPAPAAASAHPIPSAAGSEA